MAEMIPSSIRLPVDSLKLLAETAKEIGMRQPETHRQALIFGCYEVKRRFKKKKK